MPAEWWVHKFGGTSVANAERYRQVAAIMLKEPGARKAIVVSAMSGVTDRLHELAELARKQDDVWKTKLEELKQKHLEAIQLLSIPVLLSVIEKDVIDIQDLLKAIWLSKGYSEATLELIAGYGEIWSAQILAAYLTQTGIPSQGKTDWLDARKVLVVRPGETGPVVDWTISKERFQNWAANATPWIVITGYVASTPEGTATTLKRNGSDFSASIFGALADSAAITIWTDVDGVLSADPRRVPEAVVLDEMSYSEAIELAYFGAKVLHPHTMSPALMQNIPIWIRNTLNPTHPGTKIHRTPQRTSAGTSPVRGFSTVDKVALINVEGTGMIGVPGVAHRLFGALREVGVSVIMISQASSEHSICFAVPEAQGAQARETVEKVFFAELHHGQIECVELVSGCSILAAVGDNMVEAPGVSAKLFGALGKAGINIRAIAQGSSERNISVVIGQAESTKALRAVHSGFYLSDQTISVGVIGPGLIGSAFLKQLEAQGPLLRERFKIDLRVRGITDTKKMLLANPRIALDQWKNSFAQSSATADLDAFAKHIQADHLPHCVLIDCTSSEAVASRYTDWLAKGIHVITPNKKASSGSLARYQEIRSLGHKVHTHYFYEATVGAGLPVITTLRDLVQTGDKILQIDGVLSGTLSYIFNTLDGKKPFSAIVADAKQKGYTEPDPRDDLSGLDVARKLIILAREMGLPLELNQIEVQSLVPPELQKVATTEEYLRELPKFDDRVATMYLAAEKAGEVLRYVGVIRPDGRTTVELKRYPKSHAFARITGSDNIIAFKTQRYNSQPLIVQGPGAGPEVTAGGVFADLLRLCSYLGAQT